MVAIRVAAEMVKLKFQMKTHKSRYHVCNDTIIRNVFWIIFGALLPRLCSTCLLCIAWITILFEFTARDEKTSCNFCASTYSPCIISIKYIRSCSFRIKSLSYLIFKIIKLLFFAIKSLSYFICPKLNFSNFEQAPFPMSDHIDVNEEVLYGE